MAKNWWFKFDFKAWRTDSDLRRCSLETRGLWLEILCVMYEMETYKVSGSRDELARMIGCLPEELARCVIEMKRNGNADVTECNGTVTLVSRRLKRELTCREKTRLRVERHRSNGEVTPQSKSNKKEVRKEEEPADAAPDPVQERIWKDGVDLLTRSGSKEPSARSCLGRWAKTFGPESLATAISVTMAKNPPDPKAYIAGILNNGTNNKRNSPHAGKSTADIYSELNVNRAVS